MANPRQVNWSEVSFDVGWGTLRGKRCTTGCSVATPALRLLSFHGFLDNANTFDRLVPLLPDGLEILVIDFPGHGLSDHLPHGAHYSTMTLVINVRAVVLKLGWKSFAIMAHSYGCFVSAYYLAMFPENVTAFIVFDFIKPFSMEESTSIWRMGVDLILQNEENKKSFAVYSEEEALNRIIRSRKGGPNSDIMNVDEDCARILLSRSAVRVKNGFTWRHDHKVRGRFLKLYGKNNWLHVLSKIKCPVIFLHPRNGIITRPVSEYEEILTTYQANAKVFKYVQVEGTHHVHLTKPENVAPTLVEFLSIIMNSTKLELAKL